MDKDFCNDRAGNRFMQTTSSILTVNYGKYGLRYVFLYTRFSDEFTGFKLEIYNSGTILSFRFTTVWSKHPF